MEFKLNLMGNRPAAGDLVLAAEVPLSGVKFIEVFGQAMRRSIDHVGRHRHITLGALATYEITVPQQIAIESGLFAETDTVAIYVENNLLSNFIFYSASMHYGASGRPCYPYMQNEATLVSIIDELAFLDEWARTGYATVLRMNGGQMVDASYNGGSSSESCNNGNTTGCTSGGVGCDGCTCGHNDHRPPMYDRPPEHHQHTPPPPPPQKKPPVDHEEHSPSLSKPAPPPKPPRPKPPHNSPSNVKPIKPSVPPGFDTGDNGCCDDDCICDDVLKPGTIILDPITGRGDEIN